MKRDKTVSALEIAGATGIIDEASVREKYRRITQGGVIQERHLIDQAGIYADRYSEDDQLRPCQIDTAENLFEHFHEAFSFGFLGVIFLKITRWISEARYAATMNGIMNKR